jgi:hypothetical protein
MDVISEFENGDIIARIDGCDTALYAAAPDLLAVLCEMLGAAETDLLDDKSNVWRSAMIDARAAIAKAEGN